MSGLLVVANLYPDQPRRLILGRRLCRVDEVIHRAILVQDHLTKETGLRRAGRIRTISLGDDQAATSKRCAVEEGRRCHPLAGRAKQAVTCAAIESVSEIPVQAQ